MSQFFSSISTVYCRLWDLGEMARFIQGCLISNKSLVLHSGNPMDEFQLYRGLRQGEPLYFYVYFSYGRATYVYADGHP